MHIFCAFKTCRKQERLEFLYDSGLAVGKVSTDEYLLGKPVEPEKTPTEIEKVKSHSEFDKKEFQHLFIMNLFSFSYLAASRTYFFLHMFVNSFILHRS